MKFNLSIIAATVAFIVTSAFYVKKFAIDQGHGLADDSAVWGQFGDFMGGSLNPILTFISITLLIRSLSLQNEANLALRNDIKNSETHEKLNSFNALFFSLIESQKALLTGFTVDLPPNGPKAEPGITAILALESAVENLVASGTPADDVVTFIDDVDAHDCFFGTIRSFYVTVKLISERLSDDRGFSFSDRKYYLLTLINLTDFSQLRLVMISLQFSTYQAAIFLRNNAEFRGVLSELGADDDPY